MMHQNIDPESDESPAEGFDHEGPSTHEEVQASQPTLGKPKKAAKKVAKKTPVKKTAKKTAAKKSAKKTAKKTSKPKSKKASVTTSKKGKKTKRHKSPAKRAKGVTAARGVPLDGSARRKPGTNPPRSPEAEKFGKRVAAARKKLELTQRQLAKKVGLTQPGLANIERGVAGAGKKTAKGQATRAKLEKVLGL